MFANADTLKLYTFGNQGARQNGTALSNVKLTPGKAGGFFRPRNNVKVGEVKQFELKWQSNVPGTLHLAASLQSGDKKTSSRLPVVSVPGGSEYRRIVWDLTKLPKSQEYNLITDMEIKFVPAGNSAEAVIAFKDAAFSSDAMPSAAELQLANLASDGFMDVPMYTFNTVGKRQYAFALENVKLQPGKAGGIFRPRNNLPVNKIVQFEVEFKCNVPGTLRLAGSLHKDGKQFSGNMKVVPVQPGDYQRYIWNFNEMPNFDNAETMGDMELRFTPQSGSKDVVFSFRNARFNSQYRPGTEKAVAPAPSSKVQTPANPAADNASLLKLHSFGNQGKRVAGTSVDNVKLLSGKAGGFFQPNKKLPLQNIAAMSLEFKSNVPGTLKLSASLMDDKGNRFSTRLTPVKIVGNGEFEKVSFPVDQLPKYNEYTILGDVELRFTPDNPADAVIGFRNARFLTPAEAAAISKQQSNKKEFRGSDVLKHIHFSRAEAIKTPNELIARVKAATPMAFYQEKLHWESDEVYQIEIALKTNAPGYWQFACSNTFEGKRGTVRVSPQAAIPDGEYHTYIFVVHGLNNYKGYTTNWEVKWMGGEAAEVGLKSVRAVKYNNRIPDAATLQPHQPQLLGLLRPRSLAALKWVDGTNPGAVLRFYDKNLQEIPNTAVTLKPGEKSIEFTTPEYTVESYIEVLGKSSGQPVVEELQYTPPAAVGTQFWRGNWIWSQEGPGPIDHSIWFEREFTLDEVPEFAAFSGAGDDSCYTYVNGHFMGKTMRWGMTNRYDITKYLKKGRNIISCRVKNIDGQGGFIADVYVQTPSKEIYLDTDKNWRCESKSGTDTRIPRCTEPVVMIGDARCKPWNGGMMFCYAGKQAWLTPVKLEPGKMTVKVDSLPISPIRKMRFIAENEKGQRLAFNLNISPDSSQWKVGEEIAINYNLPYVDKGISKLYVEDYFVNIKGNPVLTTIDRRNAKPRPLRRASWVGSGTRPMLKMDDELIQPVFWQAPSTYGKDRIGALANFRDNNMKAYRIDVWFQDYYQEDGTLDFTIFDQYVATLLTQVPDAVFSIQVYSFMPEWWLERNPDHLSAHYNGNPRDRWLDKQALGSDKWLEDGGMLIKALIDHIKASNYADKVWGLSFTENGCGEWFYTSADANDKRSYAGYSKSDYVTYRRFLRKLYPTDEALAKAYNEPGLTLDKVEMPYLETARKGTVGTLLDPVKDRKMIDFFMYRSLRLAEVIAYFGKVTKDNTDGKWLVGAYYGYFSEMMANPRRNIQSNGHNGFIETAKSPYVDFVHAPLRYTVRKTGQPGTFMQVWDTYLLHGKMVYAEQDVRTSLSPVMEFDAGKIYCGTPEIPFGDIGQFYRSYGMTAATGSVNYWYDLEGKQFDEKVLNDVISEINDSYLTLGALRNTTPFEVAIVSDRDSAWYTQFPAPNSPNTMASEVMFKYFNQLAVPYKNLTISDLLDDSITVQPFKLYIMMPTIMLSAEKRKNLMERFRRENATVIWLYCAGPIYPDKSPSAENCGDFLGLKFRMDVTEQLPVMTTTPEFGNLVCKNHHATSPIFFPTGGYDKLIGSDNAGNALMVSKKIGTSTHYFTSLTNLPLEIYGTILDKAQVFRYSKTISTDTYWVGNDVLFIHAATNGPKSFVLPANCKARAIAGPFKGTLKSGEKFTARAGMTYGFVVEKE